MLDIKFGIAKPPAVNSVQRSIVREDNESRIENTCHLMRNVNSSENLKSVIDFSPHQLYNFLSDAYCYGSPSYKLDIPQILEQGE